MIMHLFHSNFRNLCKKWLLKIILLNLIFEHYSSTKNALSLTDVTVIFRDICVRNLAHIGPFAALVEYTMVRLRSFRSTWACSAIYDSFSWNASLALFRVHGYGQPIVNFNPRTGGGLSQPRTGGGGVDFSPPLRSRELRNASRSGKRR